MQAPGDRHRGDPAEIGPTAKQTQGPLRILAVCHSMLFDNLDPRALPAQHDELCGLGPNIDSQGVPTHAPRDSPLTLVSVAKVDNPIFMGFETSVITDPNVSSATLLA